MGSVQYVADPEEYCQWMKCLLCMVKASVSSSGWSSADELMKIGGDGGGGPEPKTKKDLLKIAFIQKR